MTKYVESKDEKIDAKKLRSAGLSAAQIKAFKTWDEKHRKVKTQEADNKIDEAKIKSLKKKGK